MAPANQNLKEPSSNPEQWGLHYTCTHNTGPLPFCPPTPPTPHTLEGSISFFPRMHTVRMVVFCVQLCVLAHCHNVLCVAECCHAPLLHQDILSYSFHTNGFCVPPAFSPGVEALRVSEGQGLFSVDKFFFFFLLFKNVDLQPPSLALPPPWVPLQPSLDNLQTPLVALQVRPNCVPKY